MTHNPRIALKPWSFEIGSEKAGSWVEFGVPHNSIEDVPRVLLGSSKNPTLGRSTAAGSRFSTGCLTCIVLHQQDTKYLMET